MTQRYTHPESLARMADGGCPECGQPAGVHDADIRFWVRSGCDLLPSGVTDRIEQYRADVAVSR